MRVITPGGRGVVLVDMGKPVASYLKAGETTLRGSESLELLETEPDAEYDLVAYEDSEFAETMDICASEGLRLEDYRAGTAEPRGAEKGGGLLSSLFRRFSSGKKEAETVPSPPAGSREEEKVREPAPPGTVTPEPVPGTAKPPGPAVEQEEPVAAEIPPAPPSPPPAAAEEESELSAIVKRLSRSRGVSPPPEEAPPAAPASVPPPVPPQTEEGASPSFGEPEEEEESAVPGDDTLDEILRRYKSGGKAPAPGEEAPPGPAMAEGEPGEQSRVEMNAMMKRITRLDIVSFKKEMEDVKSTALRDSTAAREGREGAREPVARGAVPPPSGPEKEMVPEEPVPQEPTRPSTDMDDLKAFIRQLESLGIETREPVSEEIPVALAEPPAPPPPRPKEFPALTIVPGVLGSLPPRRREVPESPPEGSGKTAPPLRFGEPLEADRKLDHRPVVLPEAPQAAETPAPDTVIQWKEDELLSGSAAGTATLPGAPQAEAPKSRPVILKREIDIRRVERRPERPRAALPLLDDAKIAKIMRQPGVIAVSVFQEGFAVQSVGKADFDQVAANAEDLLRAGTKIASDIHIGGLHQIILESAGGKLIISPFGDLNLCVFTDADANLGLIRVAIRSLQAE
ncbi:MAG: roadblock/LC7 domain-containing protein [Methanomicrobiales archaeon]|nr:roadblock/LC7 domain-containing protein [Methanomicrobiales archaeon]